MSWQRLIRFEDEYGEEVFGEPLIDGPEELYSLLDQGELYATVLLGDSLMTLEPTPCNVKVKVLKQLLKPADVPGIKCVGLNYAKHSKWADGRTMCAGAVEGSSSNLAALFSPRIRPETSSLSHHLSQATNCHHRARLRHFGPQDRSRYSGLGRRTQYRNWQDGKGYQGRGRFGVYRRVYCL